MYGRVTNVLEATTIILHVYKTQTKNRVPKHADGAQCVNRAPVNVATDMSKNIADAQQSHCQSSLHRLTIWDWLITPPKRANANLLDCTANVVMIQLAAPMHANCHTPGGRTFGIKIRHITYKIGHIITSVNTSQTQINAALLRAEIRRSPPAIYSKQGRGDATNKMVAIGIPSFNYANLCLVHQ